MRPEGQLAGLTGSVRRSDDGRRLVLRDTIIWDKGPSGRKESTDNRCRHNYEYVLFFTKSASGYWYNQDALRIPLAGGQPYSVNGADTPRTATNPASCAEMGIAISASRAIPGSHRRRRVAHPTEWIGDGSHRAAFPEELVRRVLLLAAPPSRNAARGNRARSLWRLRHRVGRREADGAEVDLHRLEPSLCGGGPAARAD